MSRLSVNFAGLEWKTPWLIGSSPLTATLPRIKKADKWGAGAVSIKLTFLKLPFEAKPRYYILDSKDIFVGLDKRLEAEEAQKLIRRAKKETNLIVMGNIMGPGTNAEGWAKLAVLMEEAGADMVELNMSCPNIGLMAKTLGAKLPPDVLMEGASLGQIPELSKEVTRSVKEAVSIPVMPKMTPEASDMTAVAKACMEGGAAAISLTNGPVAMPGCDIYNDGKPLWAGVKTVPIGGAAGDWIRPLLLGRLAQIAMKDPNIPLNAGGGIRNWKHAVEAIMYGATTLTICTYIMLRGFKVLESLNQDLEKYMKEQGYDSIGDFRGCALKYLTTPNAVKYIPIVARVVNEKCNGCGMCTDFGHCEAFMLTGEKAEVDVEKCVGCGFCRSVCPQNAIEYIEL